jgi:general secretion pathway protein H
MGRVEQNRCASASMGADAATGAAGGFTLLELLVVLAIMALVAAAAPALVAKLSPGAQVQALARELGASLRAARGRAIAANREATFTLDVNSGKFGVDNRAGGRVAPGIRLAFVAAQVEQIDETAAQIRFFPDGSSTGGRIRVAKDNQHRDVAVDWLTGRVVVE